MLNRRQAQLDALQQQVSALRRLTHTEQQIQVELKVFEISRAKMKAAGITFPDSKDGESTSATDHPAADKPHRGDTPRVIGSDIELSSFLDRLKAKGVAKVVAEPTLITVSGRPAWFNSGGEFPFVVRRGNEDPTVEYKQFGTRVQFLAISVGNNQLRLEVTTKISQLDERSSVRANEVVVPGLRVRELDTGAELKSGQTVLIVGPAQFGQTDAAAESTVKTTSDSSNADKETNCDETEMLVVATARLISPPDNGGDSKAESRSCGSAHRSKLSK